MKAKIKDLLICLILFLFIDFSAMAQSDSNIGTHPVSSPFNVEQQQMIEKIVHDYLLSHPEVLMDMATALQKKQQAQWQETAAKIVPQIQNPLFSSVTSPMLGNLQGNVTLVEFFDYQCPHCKDMAPQIKDIVAHDPQLKVILKPLPIFGEVSTFATKVALSAQKQGKFEAFHDALMKVPTTLSQEIILAVAKQVGLNMTQLDNDMKNPLWDAEIKQNEQLAKQLKLTGTPAFVVAQVKINDKTHQVEALKNTLLIPGAVGENLLIEAIGGVRAK